MNIRTLAIILIACGIGLLTAAIVRGYFTNKLTCVYGTAGGATIRALEGIWAPREVYLNVIIEGGEMNVSLYCNGVLLKKWSNTRGFIYRVKIEKRAYSYLVFTPLNPKKEYTINLKAEFYGIEKDLFIHGLIAIIVGCSLYILNVIKRRVLAALLIAIILGTLLPVPRIACKPLWFKKGTYAVYWSPGVPSILLENNTAIHGNWTVYFSWKYINISGSRALLFVNFTAVGYRARFYGKEFMSPSFMKTGYIEVVLETREVYYKGKKVGITGLFIWPLPQVGKKITLVGIYDKVFEGVVSKESIEASLLHFKPQDQWVYIVYFNATLWTVEGRRYSAKGVNFYDTDTGLLIWGIPMPEPVFLAVGIKAFLWPMWLVDTNVDIGPPVVWRSISLFLPRFIGIVVAVIPLIIAIIVILWRRMRLKKSA
ncbi:MAG: hypothetical protein DRN04_12820 [Thermoprotei archaeon]|nr:MAG: hypothetical protein DRN04_12820 [Thermoprotei archaeon]